MSPLRPDDPSAAERHDGPLSEADFETLRALIHERSGIALHGSKRSVVAARLARRMRAKGIESHADYCALVRSLEPQDDELRELINCVTTNKTDFFREPHHFEFLRSRAFPELEARARAGGPRRVRLWSAACSSGEEPYSLAISALEHFAAKDWRIEILATDIDTDVLARASAGVYGAERVERLAPERVQRYFLRGEGRWSGHYKVRAEVAELVSFRRLNFIDSQWGVDAPFDAIFCRNVVIYFDRATQNSLFQRLHARLAEGAYLMVGYSESAGALPELFEALPGTVWRRRTLAPPPLPAREPRAGPSGA